MGKYVNTFITLFAIISLLAIQGLLDAYGEVSPVTCVVITNPVEYKPASNYTVGVNPKYVKVIPGSSVTLDVTVLAKNNFADAIALDIVGLPEGMNAVFDPEKGTTDFTSKLTISVDEMICPGIYTPTIIAQNLNLQLTDFKLEVASISSVREEMSNEIAELSSKIDELERTIKENQSNNFAAYVAVLLVAIIGSFLLGAFALYVLLHYVKSSSTGNGVKLQSIVELLKQLIEKSGKQVETKSEIKSDVKQVISKEQTTEPKVGDIWYAYCPTCGLRTEHSKDYEGVFCVRCGNRSS